MTDIFFYHLERSSLETALPELLEKTLEAKKRALVLAQFDAQVEELSDVLWAYKSESWLPHGTSTDGFAAQQPVWLSSLDENANGSSFLFLTNGAASDNVAEYERCFELFDGNNPDAVISARKRWKVYKEAEHKLAYYQQNASGGWSQKS
jgi:DNA polymerase-3 subunit chi